MNGDDLPHLKDDGRLSTRSFAFVVRFTCGVKR
jgi:hypothetical protein